MSTNKFITDLTEEFRYEEEAKYHVPFTDSTNYENLILNANVEMEADPLDVKLIIDFASYHFEYCMFSYVQLKDKQLALFHLTKATYYSDIAILQGVNSCGCLKENPFIISNKAVFFMCLQLLTRGFESFENIGNNLLDSLNGRNCIIKKGYNKATISWFILKLYSLYTNKEITLHKLLQPKDTYGYEDILDVWDSKEEAIIEKNLQMLCEIHLAQADLDLADADLDDDIYNVKYRELFLPALYTFPFEVLVWLKLREKQGLKNPTKFSHPLMSTPIARFFLDLKEPLPKPKELPYAKELLVKLKEKCPDIEIPEYLA